MGELSLPELLTSIGALSAAIAAIGVLFKWRTEKKKMLAERDDLVAKTSNALLEASDRANKAWESIANEQEARAERHIAEARAAYELAALHQQHREACEKKLAEVSESSVKQQAELHQTKGEVATMREEIRRLEGAVLVLRRLGKALDSAAADEAGR